MTRPNGVLWSLVAVAGLSALAGAMFAAVAYGRRKERQAWLIDRSHP